MNYHDTWIASLTGSLILLGAACATSAALHFLLFRVRTHFARSSTRLSLIDQGTFRWLIAAAPFVVIKLGVVMVPALPATALQITDKVAFALIVFFVTMAINAALSAFAHSHQTLRDGQQRLRSTGALQFVKLVIFIAAVLVVICEVTGKQIGLLLSGIGAMSAVLMLVFKDTLLGLVAGFQLSSNDMLRIGDWITMPNAGADGTVVDITLNTVKVTNFDHTIITIPTWKLITESYQNWRGMTEAGGRRIKRALYLDATSVHFLDAQDISRLEHFTLLTDYLADKRTALTRFNGTLGIAGDYTANRRQLTNIGTFRAYVQQYLDHHPRIHHEMTCMARQLASGAQGVPLELYCFTNTTNWADYETIQADLFDHLIAVLPEFGLRVYQQPAGFDLQLGLAARQQTHDILNVEPALTRKGPIDAVPAS